MGSDSRGQVRPHVPPALAPLAGHTRSERLRRMLATGTPVAAPGAFDCITARLVEAAGFDAMYLTGSGMSLSALGAPDVGLMSFAEVLDRVKRIADSVTIPVIADADTGYGGALNVMRTVREFERAGVSAIQIEDQAWPKRCGHEPGRVLVSCAEMVARIRRAADARAHAETVIIARTDARSDFGLDAALERAHAYRDAGADLVFVESPESIDELAAVGTQFPGTCLANMVEGGRTPLVALPRLGELGFAIVIFPNSLTRLFAAQGLRLLAQIRSSGSTDAFAEALMSHGELWALFRNAEWLAAERGEPIDASVAGASPSSVP